ncbi:MAG: diguanylate cyclase [Sphingobium sp.]|uniref:GGDEF domain-containing protein n=1 Tax=Sphingobium sp. TaxID=1912891 RepID=UPI0029B695DC|nr:diguanylate cyclase [Sphingobium sp.]MDX3910257.1 diguanylate cyclase [Sphingobium sp.]
MKVEDTATNGRRPRAGVTWLTAAAPYFVLAVLTIQYTSNGHNVATVWPANAVLLAMLLSKARPGFLSILSAGFAAIFAATLLTRGALSASLLYGCSNLAEVAIAALMLRGRVDGNGLLSTPKTVGWFILVAGLIAPVVSSFGGAATGWLVFGHSFGPSLKTWFMSDALGLLVFTPFFRAAFNGDYGRWLRDLSWAERVEAGVVLALNAMLTCHVFFIAPRPLLFALFAPVMLATFRLGSLGTKLAILTVAIIGTMATMQGVGPVAMHTSDLAEQSYLFQGFLLVLLVTSLPVAADLSARRKLVSDLAENEKALRLRETELSLLASTDSLTGVLNRAAFREKAKAEMAHNHGQPLCLVAIDLDHFKDVNDNWGHHVGDAALVHVASVLRAHLRGGDVIGRLGGDEFMLILSGTSLDRANEVCDRLQASLRERPLHLQGGPAVLLAMSCGIAAWDGETSFDELAQIADASLYRSKAQHPKRMRLFA